MEIVIECKPDEALIRTLGYHRKQITHQSSKARVLSYLEKNPNSIGIVDEDPEAANSGYFNKYKKHEKENFDIQQWSVPNKPTKLIIIRPRLEEWILKHAANSSVNPSTFSLATTGHQLHKTIIEQLPKFELMLKEMLRNKSEALIYLKKCIGDK